MNLGPNFRGYVLDLERVRLRFDERGWWYWSFMWGEWFPADRIDDIEDILHAAGVKYRRQLITSAVKRTREGLNDPNFGKRGHR